uniref:Uncharacterized protein n=1 Tax=viral metagenome TaxID=1070528 RepID=A0A6M3XBY6_9ZZZZ
MDDSKIAIISYETILNLLNGKNSGAVALYLFYYKTCFLQKTNIIHATDTFCMTGLEWGKQKFYKAKAILIKLRLVELHKIRNKETGQIQMIYIKIPYFLTLARILLDQTVEISTTQETPPLGNRETNAYNKKLNAYKEEKENAYNKKENKELCDFDEILEYWNSREIIIHKKISNLGIKKILSTISFLGIDRLKEAIKNYSLVLKDERFYFNYKWHLADFCIRGMSKEGLELKKGFWMFLPENKPFQRFSANGKEINPYEEEFRPITSTYDKFNVLDTSRSTYYGFDINLIKSPTVIINDIKDRLVLGLKLTRTDFKDIELIVASYMFRRKSDPQPKKLEGWLEVWRRLKPEFQEGD